MSTFGASLGQYDFSADIIFSMILSVIPFLKIHLCLMQQ